MKKLFLNRWKFQDSWEQNFEESFSWRKSSAISAMVDPDGLILHALLRVFKSSFSSNRFQMLPPILSRSPRKRGKYVENFGNGEHVSRRELRRRGRRIMQRKQRDLIHAFPRGRSQVLQSFCDHVPRAVQMFDRPQLRALNFSLLFHFCSHWCYYNGITVYNLLLLQPLN